MSSSDWEATTRVLERLADGYTEAIEEADAVLERFEGRSQSGRAEALLKELRRLKVDLRAQRLQVRRQRRRFLQGKLDELERRLDRVDPDAERRDLERTRGSRHLRRNGTDTGADGGQRPR